MSNRNIYNWRLKIIVSIVGMLLFVLGKSQHSFLSVHHLLSKGDSLHGVIRIDQSVCCRYAVLHVVLLDQSQQIDDYVKYLVAENDSIPFSVKKSSSKTPAGVLLWMESKNEYCSNATFALQSGKQFLLGESQQRNNWYMESGKALKNYYTRMIVDLSKFSPVIKTRNIFVRNQHGQIVAKSKPDNNGIVPIDMPLFDNDHYQIVTADGQLLHKLSAADTNVAKTSGFALRASITNDSLQVEIRRGIMEQRNNAVLKGWMKETLLFETEAQFRLDTNVVETSISLQQLPNDFIELKLTDGHGNIVASRWLLVGSTSKQSKPCELTFPFVLSDSSLLNEYLIAARKTVVPVEDMPSFDAHFFAPTLKGKSISYQIQLADGSIEEIGDVIVDSTGHISISGLQFKGKASIHFYGNNMSAFSVISALPDTFPDGLLAQLKALKLKQHEFQNMPDNRQNEDSILVGESSVDIVGKIKSRNEVLEEKYINSNMFREPFSVNLDLENDPYTANYSVYDYLLKNVPGLSVQTDPQNPTARNFRYRQGIVEVYLDEIYIGQVADLPFKNLLDIGYIRFIKKPVSSSRNAAGGGLLKGGSAIAGVTATLLLYTRKNAGDETGKRVQSNRFEIMGFAND